MAAAVQIQGMQGAIDVARDIEGIAIAARELLDEELHARDDDRTRKHAEDAANREAVLKSLKQRRTLSPGYYVRALYLFDLDRTMGMVQMTLDQVTGSELAGVQAIRAMKAKFAEEHPQCPHCGTMQFFAATPKCRKCGANLKRSN